MRYAVLLTLLAITPVARASGPVTLDFTSRYLRSDYDRYPSRLDTVTTFRIPKLKLWANNLYVRDFGNSVNDSWNNKLTMGGEVYRDKILAVSPVYQRQDQIGKRGVNRVGIEVRFHLGD